MGTLEDYIKWFGEIFGPIRFNEDNANWGNIFTGESEY